MQDFGLPYAGKKCPHHPLFDDDFKSSEYEPVDLDTLSEESTQKILFGGILSAQIASILAALSISHTDSVHLPDPLSSQESLTELRDVKLIDFTNLKGSIGKLTDMVINIINEEV